MFSIVPPDQNKTPPLVDRDCLNNGESGDASTFVACPAIGNPSHKKGQQNNGDNNDCQNHYGADSIVVDETEQLVYEFHRILLQKP